MKHSVEIELICLAINPAENFEYNVILDDEGNFPSCKLKEKTIKESLNDLLKKHIETTTDWIKPNSLNVSDTDGVIKISFSTMVPYDFSPVEGSWANLRLALGSSMEVDNLISAIRKSKYEFY